MKNTLILALIISLVACQKNTSSEVKPLVNESKKVQSRGTGNDFQLYSFTLTEANVKKGQQQITLDWSAVGESKIDLYSIWTYRKPLSGSRYWSGLGYVYSSNNDAIQDHTYSWTESTNETDTVYVLLKILWLNGNTTYSDTLWYMPKSKLNSNGGGGRGHWKGGW
jgi:hypothetical protein